MKAIEARQVPNGWKLVPVEPTEEMMAALWNAMFEEAFKDQHAIVGAGYDALLAAAPQHAQQMS